MGNVAQLAKDTSTSRFNAVTFGNRSKYDLLPWEDAAEYSALMDAMIEHHTPVGPTETHLAQELANVIWRKQRLRVTEAAILRSGVGVQLNDQHGRERIIRHALTGKKPPIQAAFIRVELADTLEANENPNALAEDEKDYERVSGLYHKLQESGDYAGTIKALGAWGREYEADWVGETLIYDQPSGEEVEQRFDKSAASLAFYLRHELMPHLNSSANLSRYGTDIAAQVVGASAPLEKLEQITRYETGLDRKFERILAMLIKLQEIRKGP